jgi:hypothetical protein
MRLVEAVRRCRSEGDRVIRRRKHPPATGLVARLAKQIAVQDRLVELVRRDYEAFLVARTGIELQEQLEDLADRAPFSLVGLLRVEVQKGLANSAAYGWQPTRLENVSVGGVGHGVRPAIKTATECGGIAVTDLATATQGPDLRGKRLWRPLPLAWKCSTG